jgi:hypothetical protein
LSWPRIVTACPLRCVRAEMSCPRFCRVDLRPRQPVARTVLAVRGRSFARRQLAIRRVGLHLRLQLRTDRVQAGRRRRVLEPGLAQTEKLLRALRADLGFQCRAP